MDRSTDLYLLGHSEIFRDLSTEALEQIRNASVRQRLSRGETLFEQDAPASAFFLIVHGRLRMTQSTLAGQQVIMQYIGSGESAGYSVIVGKETYSSTVVAIDDSVLLSWTRARFQELLAKHPQIAGNALVVVRSRYEELQNRVRELATESVEKRIAHTILRLVQQAGRRTAIGIEVAFPLSRQDIAEMAGTTLHTVSRTISAWESDGIIDSGRRRVVVRKPQQLNDIANRT
jgi:CRP/FNR family transcriptional regulator, nitrogen oxide reductase regulator